jgi:hypothetical protein
MQHRDALTPSGTQGTTNLIENLGMENFGITTEHEAPISSYDMWCFTLKSKKY